MLVSLHSFEDFRAFLFQFLRRKLCFPLQSLQVSLKLFDRKAFEERVIARPLVSALLSHESCRLYSLYGLLFDRYRGNHRRHCGLLGRGHRTRGRRRWRGDSRTHSCGAWLFKFWLFLCSDRRRRGVLRRTCGAAARLDHGLVIHRGVKRLRAIGVAGRSLRFLMLLTVANCLSHGPACRASCIFAATIVTQHVSTTQAMLHGALWVATVRNMLPQLLHTGTMRGNRTRPGFVLTPRCMT
mmetsp:Transcript_2522/g.5308  ORF Transcript_2522/g.5308 Transcript_2522/m.5308 type:complete len:240 (-) Transcript_2522:2127-2846(-)